MERHYQLLKTQKNEIFKILQEVGLEPANFKWTHIDLMPSDDRVVLRLNYLDGKYYFQFMMNKDSNYHYCCEVSPADEKAVGYKKSLNWYEQKTNVRRWAKYLKREIEAPDLWAEIEKYRATLPLVTGEQLVNEPIPAYETEEIYDRMQLLADKIEEEFKLNEEQSQFVRSKLNYLADAAKRQPRRDWEFMFIGVFINIAFYLVLEPVKVQQFWQFVKSIVGPFIHLIGS